MDKNKIKKIFAKALAVAELAQDTPRAQKVKAQHLGNCCCEYTELDKIIDALAVSYRGEDIPAKLGCTEPLTCIINLRQDCTLKFTLPLTDTLDQAVEQCFFLCKETIIQLQKEEIAEWGISSRELFGEENTSIH